MPSDIRSFFGGGSQERKAPPKKAESTSQSKRSKTRHVISDDSDEEVAPAAKSTPTQKSKASKPRVNSPKHEETTASSYFASSSKGRPTKSTPTKSIATPVKKGASTTTTPVKSESKPLKKEDATELPNGRGTRSSGRKKSAAKYVEDDDGNDDEDVAMLDDEPSGDDLSKADYKTGKAINDEYEEGSDDAFEVVPKPVNGLRKRGASNVKDDSDDNKSKKKEHGNKSNGVAKVSKKRKSVDLDDDSEEEDISSKRKSPKKSKPPAKKAKTPSKAEKDTPKESAAMEKIMDSITTIKAPSPPPRDGEKKFNFAGAHQNSGPPPAAGSKEIPTGQENCLAGLSFVFTGMLETLGRDEGQNLVKRYGGKISGAPSSKTSFVVLGSDAGPKKLEVIKKFNLKSINEDGLFELISKLPANGGDSNAAIANEAKKKKEEEKIREAAAEIDKAEKKKAKEVADLGNRPDLRPSPPDPGSQLWTTKYAPSAMNQICGNKGQVEKLQKWLRAWPANLKKDFKHAGADGTAKFRAVLIHGPPGIGKTTAAHLVAKMEGYDVIESNASDTRSKKLVETGLHGVLDNTSLLGFYSGEHQKVDAKRKKIVLIMDEVDGMSAGDRGGVGALAQVCKRTQIPMILICNDKRSPKMKPFDFVTFDMVFRRPTTQDIRSRIMTICYREGLKMPPPVIDALIEGSNADIRQIINLVSAVKLDPNIPDFDQSKAMSKAWEKHIILKPWDTTQKILGAGWFLPTNKKSLQDKIELYFNDHDLSFLMLQENYLKTTPTAIGHSDARDKKLKSLELASKAAESISDGDLVDRMIHGPQQHWSLMPTHAVFSFVRPASFVAGTLVGSGGVSFTSWLGQNSKQSKLIRFVKDIQGHMRLKSSGDRHEIRQQYLPVLWTKLVKKLEVEGKESVDEVIDLMDSYYLTKDDYDAIMELGVGYMDQDHVKIETQTKSAFTRLYNSQPHPMPFMKASNVAAPPKAAKVKPDLEEAIDESDVEEEAEAVKADDDDDVDISKDKFIKQAKKSAAPKASSRKSAQGKGKGKAIRDETSDSEDAKPQKGKGSAKGRGASNKAKGKK